jgi:membrane fusion protein (multidrug efflux system)
MKFFQKPIQLVIAICILATAISGVGYYFYSLHLKSKQQSNQLTAVPVEVDLVSKGTLTRRLTVVGNLIASNTVIIRPNINGQVTKVLAHGGEEVRKGDMLFELDDRSARAKLKDNQAVLAHARIKFNRIEILTEKKVTPTKLLDEARAELLKAEAAVEGTQKELDDTRIAAPYEGVVSLHKISVGALVSPQVEMLTITDVDPIKVEFKISAKYLPFISTGQTITLTVDSFPGQTFKGEIEAIDTKVDPISQQIDVRGTLENKKRLLKPGSFCRVSLIAGSKSDALIVRNEAVLSIGDVSYVWKVVQDPENPKTYFTFRVAVLTGIQEEDRVEIVKGLEENDIVVTVGQNRLHDGGQVTFDLSSIGKGAAAPAKPADDKAKQEKPKEEKTDTKKSE